MHISSKRTTGTCLLPRKPSKACNMVLCTFPAMSQYTACCFVVFSASGAIFSSGKEPLVDNFLAKLPAPPPPLNRSRWRKTGSPPSLANVLATVRSCSSNMESNTLRSSASPKRSPNSQLTSCNNKRTMASRELMALTWQTPAQMRHKSLKGVPDNGRSGCVLNSSEAWNTIFVNDLTSADNDERISASAFSEAHNFMWCTQTSWTNFCEGCERWTG
mmetsp:Transcript_126658/g.405546  ORF Transcript_126658/g.405546 Transcript_126658/m.405546 type:complete len:217 (-) Transcript_126658:1355-2005(-)